MAIDKLKKKKAEEDKKVKYTACRYQIVKDTVGNYHAIIEVGKIDVMNGKFYSIKGANVKKYSVPLDKNKKGQLKRYRLKKQIKKYLKNYSELENITKFIEI